MAERLVPTPAAVPEGVPVTKMTGMMKMMSFNPKSITSDAELAELSGLLQILGVPEATNEELNRSSTVGSPVSSRSQWETNRQRRI